MNDSYTKLLVTGDTDFSDSSVGHTDVHTPTLHENNYPNHLPYIDTLIKKIGAGAMHFEAGSKNAVEYPGSVDWVLPYPLIGGKFSINFWLYLTNLNAGYICGIGSNYYDGWHVSWSGTYLEFLHAGNNGSINRYYIKRANWSPAVNTWYHISAQADNNNSPNWIFEVNGSPIPVTYSLMETDSWTGFHVNWPFCIGTIEGSYTVIDGLIDEFQLDHGICRSTYSSTYTETFNDGISIADVFTRQANVVKGDTLYLVDSRSKQVIISKGDTLYLSDAFTRKARITKSDTLQLADSRSKQAYIKKSDNVFFTDAFSEQGKNIYFGFLSDDVYLSDSRQKRAYISKNDYMYMSDIKSIFARKIKNDIIHIDDLLSKVANRVYNDIVTFTDHIRNEIAFTFSNLFNISDRFTKVVTTSKNDYLHIYDVISKQQVGKKFNDVVAFTDTRQKHITFTFNDIINLIDSLAIRRDIEFNDTIHISDSDTKEADIMLSDLVNFTETFGNKHIDIVVDDKIVFEDIRTAIARMGMSDNVAFTDDYFGIKLKTTDMVTIHLAVRLP